MYNVQMKDFKVAEARARFGELLDQAEAGESVFIERRGVRYRLEADRPSSRAPARSQFFASIHPDVLSGEWTWNWSKRSLTFRARRKRR